MAKETNYQWHFDKQTGQDKGPNEPMEQNFKWHKYASLVREAIQNSLDVPLDKNQPVRVSFKIRRILKNDLLPFFEIEKHIQGCLDYYNANPGAKEMYEPMLEYLRGIGDRGKLHYIEVADYNTTGMLYVKGSRTTEFYSFVRSAGVSSKSSDAAGGSYGFGKAAYFYISNIRTLFVSTRTADNKCFFEGVSSLCTHYYKGAGNDNIYTSVGYFDNNGGEPVSNEAEIIMPERFKRSESGTTICIMGIDADVEDQIYHEMTEAVLRNFWAAIYESKLTVTVGEQEIRSDNVRALMTQFFPQEDDATTWQANLIPTPYIKALADWETDKRFCRKIEQDMPTLGHVVLYAYKKKGAADKVIYMRKPRMYVFSKKTRSNFGFYGVFVCDSDRGNNILRKMENPAHNEWAVKNCSKLWQTQGRQAMQELDDFIKLAIETLFPSKQADIQEIQGLKELLYIPTAVENDDDFSVESLVGDTIDTKEEQGSSPTTDKKADVEVDAPRERKRVRGQVIVDNPNPAPHSPDKRGRLHGGHGGGTHNPGGGGTSSTNTTDTFDYDPAGIGGSTKIEIPITYRSFAYSLFGKTMHRLVIRSEQDVENAEIKIYVGGEQQKKEQVPICDCSEGRIAGSSVKDVHLSANEKKVLELQFGDDMKYALIVSAHEDK